jgi:trimeric autotransporter adhesin
MMNRKEIVLIGYYLTIGLLVCLNLGIIACASKPMPKLSSIEIRSSSPAEMSVGSTMQLIVTGKYSDGSTADITNKVTWESSKTGTIVQGSGLVIAEAPGISNVTAILDGITSAPKTITVVSDFEGSVTGDCSGQMTIGATNTFLSGTFTIAIDANGVVSGSMSGAYLGTISGQVDLRGNFTAVGNFTVGSTNYITAWQGTAVVEDDSLSIQGSWTGAYNGSGTFSGTGTIQLPIFIARDVSNNAVRALGL